MKPTTDPATILVNHARHEYTADTAPKAPPPDGWERSHERQQVWVLKGYKYVNPGLFPESWFDVHSTESE